MPQKQYSHHKEHHLRKVEIALPNFGEKSINILVFGAIYQKNIYLVLFFLFFIFFQSLINTGSGRGLGKNKNIDKVSLYINFKYYILLKIIYLFFKKHKTL